MYIPIISSESVSNTVNCRSHVAWEGAAAGLPWFAERGALVLPGRHDKRFVCYFFRTLSRFLIWFWDQYPLRNIIISQKLAADAKKEYPNLYNAWREDPANFHVDGIYPIRRLWGTAREAWREILAAPVSFFSACQSYNISPICSMNRLALSGRKLLGCYPQVNPASSYLYGPWSRPWEVNILITTAHRLLL